MTLPTGVQRELDAAYQRTGITVALAKAAARLPTIFALPIAVLDNLFALYAEPSKTTTFDELEEIELCVSTE